MTEPSLGDSFEIIPPANGVPRSAWYRNRRLSTWHRPYAAMLVGLDNETIVTGAYSHDGGVCPMLAAHRRGGRTSQAAFARAWDRYTGARQGRAASERELRTLRVMLEASLSDDVSLTDVKRPKRDTGERNRMPELRRGQVKGVLTEQEIIAGIGNAYSDEILHAARMSPFAITDRLPAEALDRLYAAMRAELTDAVDRSVGRKAATLKGEKRSGPAVHARTGLPCPVCGDTVREVSFHDSSLQYCPTCQTGGKPLADRRLSRLVR